MTHHRLYGYARDRHEITWNLRFMDIRRERRIIPDGRKSYLALSATTLNNVTVRRDGRIDGISKSVAGFVEPKRKRITPSYTKVKIINIK